MESGYPLTVNNWIDMGQHRPSTKVDWIDMGPRVD